MSIKHLFDITRHKKTDNIENTILKAVGQSSKDIEKDATSLSKAARDLKGYIKNNQKTLGIYLENIDKSGSETTKVKSEINEYYTSLNEIYQKIGSEMETIRTTFKIDNK